MFPAMSVKFGQRDYPHRPTGGPRTARLLIVGLPSLMFGYIVAAVIFAPRTVPRQPGEPHLSDDGGHAEIDGLAFQAPYPHLRVAGKSKRDPVRTVFLLGDSPAAFERFDGRMVHAVGRLEVMEGFQVLTLDAAADALRAAGAEPRAADGAPRTADGALRAAGDAVGDAPGTAKRAEGDAPRAADDEEIDAPRAAVGAEVDVRSTAADVAAAERALLAPPPLDLGEIRLTGTIGYLAPKPPTTTAHETAAAPATARHADRSAGDAPAAARIALLLSDGTDGQRAHVLMNDERGPLDAGALPPGSRVEVTGRLERWGDVLWIRVPAGGLRRP